MTKSKTKAQKLKPTRKFPETPPPVTHPMVAPLRYSRDLPPRPHSLASWARAPPPSAPDRQILALPPVPPSPNISPAPTGPYEIYRRPPKSTYYPSTRAPPPLLGWSPSRDLTLPPPPTTPPTDSALHSSPTLLSCPHLRPPSPYPLYLFPLRLHSHF